MCGAGETLNVGPAINKRENYWSRSEDGVIQKGKLGDSADTGTASKRGKHSPTLGTAPAPQAKKTVLTGA